MNRRQLSQRCRIEAVASLDNLFLAARKARRGKVRRPDVEEWWMRRESELVALRVELLSGGYQPGGCAGLGVWSPPSGGGTQANTSRTKTPNAFNLLQV